MPQFPKHLNNSIKQLTSICEFKIELYINHMHIDCKTLEGEPKVHQQDSDCTKFITNI